MPVQYKPMKVIKVATKRAISKKPAADIKKKPAAEDKVNVRCLAASMLTVDPEVQPQVRDRNKAHQWDKYFDSLPTAIKESYHKMGRQSKTDMINTLVKKNDNGQYYIDTDNAMYEETVNKYEDEYGHASETAVIKAIMVQNCGGEKQLVWSFQMSTLISFIYLHIYTYICVYMLYIDLFEDLLQLLHGVNFVATWDQNETPEHSWGPTQVKRQPRKAQGGMNKSTCKCLGHFVVAALAAENDIIESYEHKTTNMNPCRF